MWDTIHCNKQILKTVTRPHIKRSWNSMLRLNCKILFHIAVRGNIKVTRGFLHLKGCISGYFALFLNLGQITPPSQASQFQLSIRTKLTPLGTGAPLPHQASVSTPVCRGSQSHKWRNVGDTNHVWEPAQLQMLLVRSQRHPVQKAAVVVCYLPIPPHPHQGHHSPRMSCGGRGTGISCRLFSHFPSIGFWWFPHSGKQKAEWEAHWIAAVCYS